MAYRTYPSIGLSRRKRLRPLVVLFLLLCCSPPLELKAASNNDIISVSESLHDPGPPAIKSCELLLTRSVLTRTFIRNTSSGDSFGERLKLYFTSDELEDLAWQSQTTPEENEYWMKAHRKGDLPIRSTAFVFDVPVVKQMNDGILVGQKRLVNILLNFLKSTLKSNLLQLLPSDLDLYWYSDFKSLGLIIEQPVGQPLISDLTLKSLVTQAATMTLSKFDQVIGLTSPHMGFYRSVSPQSWLKVGGGRAPQFASVAARLARYVQDQERPSPLRVIWFHDEGQFHIATQIISELEVRRDFIMDFLSRNYPALLVLTTQTPVVEWHTWKATTLHPEVFRTLRSSSTLEMFHEVLILKFPQIRGGLEDFVARQIWNYYQLQDQLSPPIYFKDRNYANLTQGDVGGASVDFVGLGALNSMAVDIALSQFLQNPTTQPADLVMLIQKRERELTSFVEKQRSTLRSTIAKILKSHGAKMSEAKMTCSADDCALSFYGSAETTADTVFDRSQRLIQPLLEHLQQNDLQTFRIVMIGNLNTPPAQKDTLVGHGEALEKKWRRRLYELGITLEEQYSLQAIFVMKGAEVGLGAVDLYYVTQIPENGALRNLMGQALKDVLARVNRELNTDYEPGVLSNGQNLPLL